MQPFSVVTSPAVPLDRPNVDTDAIIPKQYLKSIRRTGFGPHAFDDWRYLDAGDLETPVASRRPNLEFVLNQTRYQGAQILLARENFGCGSSREHAVWALADQGFRAVIAPSFADIFFSNSFKNGFLPVRLPEVALDALFAEAVGENRALTIDLPRQRVVTADGTEHPFEIDAFRKHCLVEGLDEIGLTLAHADDIRDFEKRHQAASPWLFTGVGEAAMAGETAR